MWRTGFAWAVAALSIACSPAHAVDGAYATSWGNGGRLQLDVTSPGSDIGKALLIQPDGKLVMAGTCRGSSGHSSFCATRQIPSGSYDSSFGPANHPGRVTYSDTATSTVDSEMNAAALTPDGGVFLAGTFLGTPSYGELAKFDAAGGVFFHFYLDFNSSADASIEASAVQADGKIVVVGRMVTNSNLHYIAVSRLQADSNTDSAFGDNGTKLITFTGGAGDVPTAVAISPDGKIVIAGKAGNQVGIARLLANGQLDDDPVLGFGDAGIVVYNWGSPSVANAIKIDRDGSLLVAGYAFANGAASGDDFFVNRLTPRGGQDPSFAIPCFPFCVAAPAYIAFNLGGSNGDAALAIAVQADGKILVSGSAIANAGLAYFAVARLTHDGYPDFSFGSSGQTSGSYGSSATNDTASAIAVGNGGIMIAGYSQDVGGSNYRFGIAKLQLDSIFANGVE